MQGRDDHLCDLTRQGRITVATALEYACNRQELDTKFRGVVAKPGGRGGQV
jgi:hypothetical protein